MNILTTTIDEKRSHITRRAQTQGARTKHNTDPMHEKRASSDWLETLFVELRRLELLTLCLQSRCATSCAIAPLEKKNKMLNFVGPGGLEPPTSSLSGMRSNHLSYGPNLYVENIQVVRLAHETKMSNSKSKRVAKLFYKITLNDCA